MPKRIVDGDSLWTSDKLATVEPHKYRAEYANILPLAHANGTFEAAPQKVWRAVYGYNRPDVTPEDVIKMLDEFERVKMLCRWMAEDGKVWGYFVGVDKPGRLPAPSRQKEEKRGIEVPKDKLEEFLNVGTYRNATAAVTERYAGLGKGLGNGSGSGFGIGKGYGNGQANPNLLTAPQHEGANSSFNPLTSNLHTRINQMLDSYPRPCPDDETRQQWFSVFKENIGCLAKEIFSGSFENALIFVEKSLQKFIAKQRDPKYAWAPERFFEDWVRKEHDVARLEKKQKSALAEEAVLLDDDEDFG